MILPLEKVGVTLHPWCIVRKACSLTVWMCSHQWCTAWLLQSVGELTPTVYGQVRYTVVIYFFICQQKHVIFMNTCSNSYLTKSWSFMEMVRKLSKLWVCTWKYGWFLLHGVQWSLIWNFMFLSSFIWFFFHVYSRETVNIVSDLTKTLTLAVSLTLFKRGFSKFAW